MNDIKCAYKKSCKKLQNDNDYTIPPHYQSGGIKNIFFFLIFLKCYFAFSIKINYIFKTCIPNDYILHNFIHRTFSKWQNQWFVGGIVNRKRLYQEVVLWRQNSSISLLWWLYNTIHGTKLHRNIGTCTCTHKEEQV